jgi:hypothetical protein
MEEIDGGDGWRRFTAEDDEVEKLRMLAKVKWHGTDLLFETTTEEK